MQDLPGTFPPLDQNSSPTVPTPAKESSDTKTERTSELFFQGLSENLVANAVLCPELFEDISADVAKLPIEETDLIGTQFEEARASLSVLAQKGESADRQERFEGTVQLMTSIILSSAEASRGKSVPVVGEAFHVDSLPIFISNDESSPLVIMCTPSPDASKGQKELALEEVGKSTNTASGSVSNLQLASHVNGTTPLQLPDLPSATDQISVAGQRIMERPDKVIITIPLADAEGAIEQAFAKANIILDSLNATSMQNAVPLPAEAHDASQPADVLQTDQNEVKEEDDIEHEKGAVAISDEGSPNIPDATRIGNEETEEMAWDEFLREGSVKAPLREKSDLIAEATIQEAVRAFTKNLKICPAPEVLVKGEVVDKAATDLGVSFRMTRRDDDGLYSVRQVGEEIIVVVPVKHKDKKDGIKDFIQYVEKGHFLPERRSFYLQKARKGEIAFVTNKELEEARKLTEQLTREFRTIFIETLHQKIKEQQKEKTHKQQDDEMIHSMVKSHERLRDRSVTDVTSTASTVQTLIANFFPNSLSSRRRFERFLAALAFEKKSEFLADMEKIYEQILIISHRHRKEDLKWSDREAEKKKEDWLGGLK